MAVTFRSRSNGGSAMNEMIIDQDQERILTYLFPDEVLEAAASSSNNERKEIFTQWICTALYYCPGP